MKKQKELTINQLATRRTTITMIVLCIAEGIVFGISFPTGGMSTAHGMLITSFTAICAGALSMQKAADIFDKKHPIPEREDEADEKQK